ncbi:MAG: sigma-70 family RNA polymerase sigma factor [Oscillospiraceae bacterium]|nr:sigma-70 family RNA polymerase sigma factor [Oscillospiraceae bacterium]
MKGADMMLEDSEIIERFNSRSEQAISETREKYGSACLMISRNILGNNLDAEECLSDALLALWNSIPPEKPNPLRAYLFRIVRNISIAKYHSNTAGKRNSFYDVALDELEECLAGAGTVEQEITARELSTLIDRFLGTLDEDSRMLFVRRYWYSDSVKELSERFGITENNLSVRLSRLRTKLRKYLQKEGYKV